ncbi:UDP-glucosyltransferase 2-like isoform X2 [Plodia interpunctella]|uniref:UDP-glucosyltransferase 2-like isoform X2 n=1 Tax=Plodia interpunctella TaxID=58824 RepID=UPI002367C2A8|nr:UDP-glucosyltransferase 2-like isoform X2 [Plodia interpunctella]
MQLVHYFGIPSDDGRIMYRVFIFSLLIINIDTARILAVFPTPSISHQVVFRHLTKELADRGHKVTVLTTDPAFPKDRTPENLIEIDLHNVSYTLWGEKFIKTAKGSTNDLIHQLQVAFNTLTEVFELQMNMDEVKSVINDNKYDLLILEGLAKPALALSHIYKVPVIQFSSLVPIYNNLQTLGASAHRLLNPEMVRQKINNLTIWEKITEMYTQFKYEMVLDHEEINQNAAIKRIFGKDIPPLSELYNNIDMLFLNCHPLWDSNRAVPPSIIYLGGIHKYPLKELTKDLKAYLDTSKNGVIYISFGTNVSPSALPAEKIQILAKVFSRLPYDVLWKWDKDELPGKPANVRISHWLPQSDLLRHPKLKLFVTQGGLQSTDEAIDAGVPLIGIPMLGDQWFNVENYVKHGIGVRLDMDTLTEEKFQDAIDKVIKDPSYRQNIAKLRDLINDQPQTPLERAVWWTEHILRHGGGRHLRSPAANIHWTQYYEVELISYLLFGLLAVLALSGAVIFYTVRHISLLINKNSKLKTN